MERVGAHGNGISARFQKDPLLDITELERGRFVMKGGVTYKK
jgi:hypothetical protein